MTTATPFRIRRAPAGVGSSRSVDLPTPHDPLEEARTAIDEHRRHAGDGAHVRDDREPLALGLPMAQRPSQHNRRVACIVLGGGPAGLTAALYPARFRLTVQVID